MSITWFDAADAIVVPIPKKRRNAERNYTPICSHYKHINSSPDISMGGSKGNPFRGKPGLGNGKASRNKKLNKGKGKAKAENGSGQPSKRSQRSGWGLIGLLGSLGAAAAGLLLFQRSKDDERLRQDKSELKRLLGRPLQYTDHGYCRMDCRFITKTEVVEMLMSGRINDRKSNLSMRPCPKYVVDAKVGPANKNVQGVFSACQDVTRVVTVIDKDTDHPCPPC